MAVSCCPRRPGCVGAACSRTGWVGFPQLLTRRSLPQFITRLAPGQPLPQLLQLAPQQFRLGFGTLLIGVALTGVIAVTLSKSSTAIAGIKQLVSRAQGDPLQGLAAIVVSPPQPADGKLEPLRRNIVHKLSKLRIAKIVSPDTTGSRRHYRLAISSPSPGAVCLL